MKTLDVDLEYLLQKSGKEIFLKILLTELIKDKNITVEELSSKYPRYASFCLFNSKIFFALLKRVLCELIEKEALQIILLSKRISEEDKKTALQYYNQL